MLRRSLKVKFENTRNNSVTLSEFNFNFFRINVSPKGKTDNQIQPMNHKISSLFSKNQSDV